MKTVLEFFGLLKKVFNVKVSQVLIALIVLFCFGRIGTVEASTLDQFYNGTPDNYSKLRDSTNNITIAQQITVGLSGNISSVKLNLQKNGSPTGNIIVSLYTDYFTSPNQSVVTSNELAASSVVNGFNEFTFANPYPVSSGQTFWLVLSGDYSISSTDNIAISYSFESPTYSGGIRGYSNSLGGWNLFLNGDFNFETYVNLPVTPTPTPQPVTVAFDASGDTYVRVEQANHNQGGSQFMQVQLSGNNRGLVKFDQQAMQSSISGTVLSAKLRLTIIDNGNNLGSTGRTIDIHRILSNWTEGNGTENDRGEGNGATWNCAIDSIISNQAKNCSGTTEWEMGQPNNPQVHPWIASATDSETITNNQTGIIEYDVTSDVASFINQTNTNYGWLIKKTNENQSGQVSFGTRESAATPQLIVTYQP